MKESKVTNLMENKIQWDREKLLSIISNLVSGLQNEYDRMQNDKNYLPNSLGIVQGIGQEIDNLCGRLSGEKSILDMAKGTSMLQK